MLPCVILGQEFFFSREIYFLGKNIFTDISDFPACKISAEYCEKSLQHVSEVSFRKQHNEFLAT